MNIEIAFMKKKNAKGELVDWIEFPQRQILIDGRRIAYCGSKADMPINYLREVGDDVKREIKDAVVAKFGSISREVKPAPVIKEIVLPEEGDSDE